MQQKTDYIRSGDQTDFLAALPGRHDGPAEAVAALLQSGREPGILHPPGSPMLLLVLRPEQKKTGDTAAGPLPALAQLGQSVQAMVGQALGFQAEAFVYQGDLLLLCRPASGEEALPGQLLQQLSRQLHGHHGVRPAIGASSPFFCIEDVAAAFNQAASAARYAEKCSSRVASFDEMALLPLPAAAPDSRWEQKLSFLLKSGNQQELGAHFAEALQTMGENRPPHEAAALLAFELYAAVLRAAKGIRPNIRLEYAWGHRFYCGVLGTGDAQQLCHTLTKFAMQVVQSLAMAQRSASATLAEKAYAYMQQRYADSDFSLQEVSCHLQVSPNYLSAVFKKERKQSFTAALTNIRMAAAYELLVAGRLKVFEIAAKTGYTDQHYFSYCFKKHYGCTPREVGMGKQSGRCPGLILPAEDAPKQAGE